MKTNALFWIILGANAGMYLLDAVANRLNLRALKPELPDEFQGVYDRDEYRRFLDYTAATANFERIEATWDLATLLAFWLLGGYGWLDRALTSLHFGFIPTGLLYLGALFLGRWVLGLPLEIYETFRIEERFGFNKTTAGTFVGDQIKSLLLSAILGGGVLAMVLAILHHGGPVAWLGAWGAASVLLIGLVYAAPALILPLFNKLTPLADGELRRQIMACAERLRFPLAEISIMDSSRRSTKANAFFTGFGEDQARCFFRHAYQQSFRPTNSLRCWRTRSGISSLGTLRGTSWWRSSTSGCFCFSRAFLSIGRRSLMRSVSPGTILIYVGLALFLVLYGPLSRLLGIARAAQSRSHEFAADRFAAENTGLPHALGEALKKLSRNNLGNLSPHPFYVILYHSHPPVLARIHALEGLKPERVMS